MIVCRARAHGAGVWLSADGEGDGNNRVQDRTGQDEDLMAVGSNHVISIQDYVILKVTYDFALSKIKYNSGKG